MIDGVDLLRRKLPNIYPSVRAPQVREWKMWSISFMKKLLIFWPDWRRLSIIGSRADSSASAAWQSEWKSVYFFARTHVVYRCRSRVAAKGELFYSPCTCFSFTRVRSHVAHFPPPQLELCSLEIMCEGTWWCWQSMVQSVKNFVIGFLRLLCLLSIWSFQAKALEGKGFLVDWIYFPWCLIWTFPANIIANHEKWRSRSTLI